MQLARRPYADPWTIRIVDSDADTTAKPGRSLSLFVAQSAVSCAPHAVDAGFLLALVHVACAQIGCAPRLRKMIRDLRGMLA